MCRLIGGAARRAGAVLALRAPHVRTLAGLTALQQPLRLRHGPCRGEVGFTFAADRETTFTLDEFTTYRYKSRSRISAVAITLITAVATRYAHASHGVPPAAAISAVRIIGVTPEA